jgi:hypothetical protein
LQKSEFAAFAFPEETRAEETRVNASENSQAKTIPLFTCSRLLCGHFKAINSHLKVFSMRDGDGVEVM